MARHHILVSYDIANDKRRRKVARVAEDYGRRVQYSVFDCFLDEPTVIKMQQALAREIEPSEDSVRFYRLCAKCRERVEVLGCGVIFSDEEVRIL